ncbi:DNA polymerase III subunit delta' [Methylophaga sp. OBS1]|uniref:DNA polymerase III subunit delta' n=1 Tax=Methylophaga sp. OBS1 TaxID=2991933 RepID=UPI0022591267|nr:DNA polymerase III subunit delta' [Methylophaga sp. OBS1]MCX4191295.1 DNA polymerase III subunit delta' [Methylophaga sp. OBS1]MCX4191759.1 DNA polymerase III subunit delta' [Methylophaga sp. OBS1]
MMANVDYSWHQKPWQHLQAMQQQGRMPHALLISGIAGVGKRAFADRLIASLLCSQTNSGFDACGHCHSCQLLAAGSHPDYKAVSPEEPGKQIKVDQIRDLKQSQTLMPKVSRGKVVLISAADQMNISAFNSLLKLLEEPQPESVLILLSENRQQLPITIKSRCQTLAIPTPDKEAALAWLQHTDMSFSEDEWLSLLRVSHGAPLAAMAAGEAGLQQSRQVTHDIALLMQAKANPVQMAADWQQFDLKSVLYQIQQMMQTKISNLLIRDEPVPGVILRQYWAIMDCISNTIKLISSQNNLNKILLIEDFMVTVMQHADQLHQLKETQR